MCAKAFPFSASARAFERRRLDARTSIQRSNSQPLLRGVSWNRPARGQKLLLCLYCASRRAPQCCICAIYAFRRKADDLSDDESVSRDERRRRLVAWLLAWRAASEGAATTDPFLTGVRDATHRFAIPLSLLMSWLASPCGLRSCRERRTGHVCDVRRPHRYCYPVAFGRRSRLHPDFRVYRRARGKTCGRNRHRVPVDEHTARRSGGRRATSRLSASRRFVATRGPIAVVAAPHAEQAANR